MPLGDLVVLSHNHILQDRSDFARFCPAAFSSAFRLSPSQTMWTGCCSSAMHFNLGLEAGGGPLELLVPAIFREALVGSKFGYWLVTLLV